MYCGDETGSFIGEVSTSSSRFGYGGEDCPKTVLPSYTNHDGTIPISTHRCPAGLLRESDNLIEGDIKPVFQPFPRSKEGKLNPDEYLKCNQGLIENMDAWENLWHEAFQQMNVRTLNKHTRGGVTIQTPRLHSSGASSSKVTNNKDKDGIDGEIVHPVLAIHAGHTYSGTGSSTTNEGVGTQYHNSIIRKQKSQMIEILYESLAAPATFLAPSPMLASFANGRQTSLVVDIGAGGTRVTPIVDGLVLGQAQRRNGRGGEWLSCMQEQVVEDLMDMKKRKDGSTCIHPRYACKRVYKSSILEEGSSASPSSSPSSSIVVTYPHEKIKESMFHRMAVSSLMYEMKTSPHVTGVDFYRTDDYVVPFLSTENNGENKGREGGENNKDADAGKNVDEDAMDVNVDGNENAAKEQSPSPSDGSDDDDDDDGMDYDAKCKKYYELPDGTRIHLQKSPKAKDLCRLPELLFADVLPYSKADTTSASAPSSKQLGHSTLSYLPLHELIKDSLSAVSDADVRKELCGNIILTGAASLATNIEGRLSLEVQHIVPSIYKCKVIATKNTVERRFAPWIGGSVLSSLGSFQQLWLSKKEYEEYGMTLATQRFP